MASIMASGTPPTPAHAADPDDARRGDELLLQAEQLERAGNDRRAEQIYVDLLERFPGNPTVLHNLGLLAMRQGRLGHARELIREALCADQGRATIHNSLGVVSRKLEQYAEAEAAYRKALELWPGYYEARFNLGALLELLGRQDEAMSEYEAIVASKSEHAMAWTRIGGIFNSRGRLDEALAALDRAVSADPALFDARYYRGWVLSSMGRHAEALSELKEATLLRPDSFEAALAIANAQRDAGQAGAALESLWRVLELRPERVATHEEINKLAWTEGRTDLFLRSFGYAREKRGDDLELLQLEAAFHLRRREFAAAEQLLRSARRIGPGRGDVAGLLARALAGQQRFEESFDLFLEAIGKEPAVLIHRQELGQNLLRSGRPEEAMRVFSHALTIAPGNILLTAGLALALRELRDPSYAALVDYSRFIRVYDLHREGSRESALFNRELSRELDSMHTAKVEPLEQTLRGGTQTSGKLFDSRAPMVGTLRERVDAAVADYIQQLPEPGTHPAALRPGRFHFAGSWSCRLTSGGFHDNHVHPMGWISSAYYARLPQGLDDKERRPGWLRFGESPLGLGTLDRPESFVRPVVGRLVLFPSFFWHGTVPFEAGQDRLAVAFDVAPGAGAAP